MANCTRAQNVNAWIQGTIRYGYVNITVLKQKIAIQTSLKHKIYNEISVMGKRVLLVL
jgi:hypothetical protein